MNTRCVCTPQAGRFDLDQLIPLAHLVLEGFGNDIEQLAETLGTEMVIMDDVGRQCVVREVARSLFTDRAARLAAAEAQARYEQEHPQPHPTRERIKAIQRRPDRGLVIDPPSWRP